MILAAVLVFLGVPLWLCAAGVVAVVFLNRGLRMRPGDIPVRVLRGGKTRWTRGHAVWVSDVFAWRSNPAGWNEHLGQVVSARLRSVEPQERKRLHRLGQDPAPDRCVVASRTRTEQPDVNSGGRQLVGALGDGCLLCRR